MSTPTQEYGWVIIDTPEKKAQFAPKRADDEVWYDGRWTGVIDDGRLEPLPIIYRRRIDPGEGYEIVERVLGDEYTQDGINWHFGIIPDKCPVLAWRRRKQQVEAQPQWPKPTWGVPPKGSMVFLQRNWCCGYTVTGEHWWMPAPPTPSPAQQAWDGKGDFETFRRGFEAGRKAEQ